MNGSPADDLVSPAWLEAALEPPLDPRWRLDEHNYQPALEHEVEARFAISNGFLGVRGALEQPTSASRPRTYIAGLFDTPDTGSAVPALVPGPDWLRLWLIIDGKPLSFESGQTLAHARTLDMQRGVLLRDWQQRDATGRVVRLRTLRLASLADRALALQVVQIQVDHSALVTLETWLEPPGAGLEPLQTQPGLTTWRTRSSDTRLSVASTASLRLGDRTLRARLTDDGMRQRWTWTALPGQPATFQRLIAVTRGAIEDDPASRALASLRRARRAGIRHMFTAHIRAWSKRWQASDVEIEGHEKDQQALRFALYHLISAANPQDEHTSIGARALTGDAYLGHVFWDTEIFLLPFYIFTWPAAARALLLYRFHTLPAARAKAARLGYRGALYAWESTDTGEEATPTAVVGPDGQIILIRSGTDEHHISAAVAYAVWQYWKATADVPFLLRAGAEIVLETARFWASRATLERDGLYHIRGVIGPDEYHEGVDDNAYTNGMARWNLARGLEVAELLETRWPERWAALRARLGIDAAELAQWRDVRARLVTGLERTTGLIEQFSGYFDLEDIDLRAYEPRAIPIDVLLGRERIQRSTVVKQADVILLLSLLWDCFEPHVREVNFHYYEPRCGHGSSLSPPIHALMAARLGDRALAERYFRLTAAIDLDDTMGNAAGGVHIGALGGLWQAAVFGFAGLSLASNGLRFAPHLPEAWKGMRFHVQWRGRILRVHIDKERQTFTATLEQGKPLVLYLESYEHRLRRGESWTCPVDNDAQRRKEGAG